jgi:hypothetical protein
MLLDQAGYHQRRGDRQCLHVRSQLVEALEQPFERLAMWRRRAQQGRGIGDQLLQVWHQLLVFRSRAQLEGTRVVAQQLDPAQENLVAQRDRLPVGLAAATAAQRQCQVRAQA